MSEQIEEIFAYYGKQRDKSSQEMVIALLRELQEAEGCITPELKVRVIETTEITDKFLNCLIKMYPSIKEAHKFLDKHPDIPFSAAEFEYSSYLESEAVEYANAISAKAFIRRELKQIKRKITGIRNSADAMDKRKNYEKRAGYL